MEFVGTGLENWDVSGVTDIRYTFSNAYKFNGDISNWDISSVTNLQYTFDDTTSLTNCTKRAIYESWDSQQSGILDSQYSSWASLCTCAVDEYVSNNACVACAAGTTNAAGDDVYGSNTTCDQSSDDTSSSSSRDDTAYIVVGVVLLWMLSH